MKYLLDIKSCISKSKALYDKSGKNIYALLSTENYIGMPKGRYAPSLLNGANEFLSSNVKIIIDVFSSFNETSQFIEFLKSEKGKEYIIVTDTSKILTICQDLNLQTISLKELEKIIDFDEDKYKLGIEETDKWNSAIERASIINWLVMVLINIIFFSSIVYWKEILDFLTISFIIPLSLIISGILFKIKKSYLLFYTIIQFIFAFTIAFVIYNFEKNNLKEINKIFSLISAIFISTRAFGNLEKYLEEHQSKFSEIWKRIY